MEKLFVAIFTLAAMLGLVLLEGTVLMWLAGAWHQLRPAVPALGLAESILMSAIVSIMTFRLPRKK